jgi:hypothetical protein
MNRRNNELLNRFMDAGYQINTIAYRDIYYYPMQYFYDIHRYESPLSIAFSDTERLQYQVEYERTVYLNHLLEIIATATILPSILPNFIWSAHLPSNEKTEPIDWSNKRFLMEASTAAFQEQHLTMERSLADILRRNIQPRFVVIHDLIAHTPFTILANGNPRDSSNALQDYYPQHQFATKVLLEMLHMVVEADSTAIIILQSDHGLHSLENETEMRKIGFTDADIVRAQTRVFCAARGVPPEPLNLSRYLMNRYAGANYPLLSEQEQRP